MSAQCRLTIVTPMPCVPTTMEVLSAPVILVLKARELRVQVGSYAEILITLFWPIFIYIFWPIFSVKIALH